MRNPRPYNQKYYIENKEKILAARHAFYEKNPEKKKGYAKEYYQKNRVKLLKMAKGYRQKTRDIVMTHYGNKCTCCGESIPQFLSIDHIDGDGSTHRKELQLKSGVQFYRWIVKNDFPKNLQINCYNCNCAKGFFGECPHKTLTNHSVSGMYEI